MNMSVQISKKVTRITPLNSEEVARSQQRISEFLSDNANKNKTRPSASSIPYAEKNTKSESSSREGSFAKGVPC